MFYKLPLLPRIGEAEIGFKFDLVSLRHKHYSINSISVQVNKGIQLTRNTELRKLYNCHFFLVD